MIVLFANSGDPDQTARPAASDLGLHCLPVTLLGVSRLQWVNDLFSGSFCICLYSSIENLVCPNI